MINLIIGPSKLSAEAREAIADFVKQMNNQVEVQAVNESGHGVWGVNFKYKDYDNRKVVEETYLTTKSTPRRIAQFVIEFDPKGDPMLAVEGDWTPMWLISPAKNFSDWIIAILDELTPTPFTATVTGLIDVCGEEDGNGDEDEESAEDCGYEGYDEHDEEECDEDCDTCPCYKCEEECEGCEDAPE